MKLKNQVLKLHRNLFQAVVQSLRDVLLEKKQADLTISHLLQSNKTWGARDRNFIADNAYYIIRYKRWLEYVIQEEAWGENALWRLLGAKLVLEQVNLPDWSEFAELKPEEIKTRSQADSIPFCIRESIPDWLDKLGRNELGENWEAEIKALNTQARFSVRVNTLKTNKKVIETLFAADQIEFSESAVAPDALIIQTRKNFRTNPAYKNGLFEIQDVSSQLVAPFLEAQPGMNVIDGCAGAGGKTLHLAALMQNEGEILAVDVNEHKLAQLKLRAARAGCTILKPMLSSELNRSHQVLLQGFADRILIDVPCSGTGVLRRKPDAKWTLTKRFIDELLETQAQILDEYAKMLHRDGLMVYSTCSILPSENEWQIQKFLDRNPGQFILVEDRRISPSTTGFDGFYMAKIKRA